MNRLAGPFAHADDFSVADQLDQLHQDNVQLAAVKPYGVHSALHSGNVSVMVGAPDIDAPVKAPLEFISVIGNIRGEIGGIAVLPDQNLILFRAKVGSLIPEGPVQFIGHALFRQDFQGILNFTVIMEHAFMEPGIILNSVFL